MWQHRVMVPESPLEATEHGLTPKGTGWFVLNAREAPWIRTRRSRRLLRVRGLRGRGGLLAARGQSHRAHARRADGAGEALLIVEGEERPLRQWDFVPAPPGRACDRRRRSLALPDARGRRPRSLYRAGLGRIHRGRGGATSRRGCRSRDDRPGRGLRALPRLGSDPVPRGLVPG